MTGLRGELYVVNDLVITANTSYCKKIILQHQFYHRERHVLRISADYCL